MLLQALENQLSVAELERSLRAAGVPKASRRKVRGEGQLALQIDTTPFKLFTRSGKTLKIHAATLLLEQISEERKQSLIQDLETLLQELKTPQC
jgi:hypothetical protein